MFAFNYVCQAFHLGQIRHSKFLSASYFRHFSSPVLQPSPGCVQKVPVVHEATANYPCVELSPPAWAKCYYNKRKESRSLMDQLKKQNFVAVVDSVLHKISAEAVPEVVSGSLDTSTPSGQFTTSACFFLAILLPILRTPSSILKRAKAAVNAIVRN